LKQSSQRQIDKLKLPNLEHVALNSASETGASYCTTTTVTTTITTTTTASGPSPGCYAASASLAVTQVCGVSNIVSSSICTVMAEGSVGSVWVWYKSLANLPSITVDPLFPSFLVRRKLMKIQFCASSFSTFILISPIIRAKRHTAVRHDCLHGMPRHITSNKDGDFVTVAINVQAHNADSVSCCINRKVSK